MRDRISVVDSTIDAFRIDNLLFKLVSFIFFGVITAGRYIIYNLDKVGAAVKAGEVTGGLGSIILRYFLALTKASWTGFWIALSTLWVIVFNSNTLYNNGAYGSLLYGLFVLIFATISISFVVRLLLDAVDKRRGEQVPRYISYIVSLVVVVLILAPLGYVISGGETFSLTLEEHQKEDSLINDTTQDLNISEAAALIDLLSEEEVG